MKIKLNDWMKSITYNKNNILEEHSDEVLSEYSPFIINKCLSAYSDCVLLANEMNKLPELDKDMQYVFLLNVIRKRKRFSPWVGKDKVDYLDVIKKYYKYNTEKALKALQILTQDQLQLIEKKLQTGGMT